MIRSSFIPFLCLLFVGTVCSSMIAPFMGYFIVQGLGEAPWKISLYAGAVSILAIFMNRWFARRIDRGDNAFPLIGIAAGGFLIANVALSIMPSFWVVLSLGIAGFGASATALATMFSLGSDVASRSDIRLSQFNAYMRATLSTAWMIGPAVAFLVADRFGNLAVFHMAIAICLLWIGLWWWAAPRGVSIRPTAATGQDADGKVDNKGLWLAAGFVFCLSFAHSLTFSALPLFYVQEAGLPGYAPGIAFTMKTFVEVLAIFSTPFLIARFGIQKSLLATAMLAVVAIQVLASVRSLPQMLAGAAMEGLYYGLFASLGISLFQTFAGSRPASVTAMYWNTLMLASILAGPMVGIVAQVYTFRIVILTASSVALLSVIILATGIYRSRVSISRPCRS